MWEDPKDALPGIILENQRRGETMTTLKELPISAQQMGDVGNSPKEGGRGENSQKGGVIHRERNSSCGQSHRGRRTLPSVMDGQNRCREEIRETGHERIAEPPEMCTIPHFFGEDIRHITDPDMLTLNISDTW
jgi:hypothetical protein